MKIITFDTETTGLDTANDRIIELCVVEGISNEKPEAPRTWRFKPAIPISPGAQAVHGISMEDLESCPSFADLAEDIFNEFASADVLIGYNVQFDIDILCAELWRVDLRLDLSDKIIIDPLKLWYQMEKRTLEAAHERFAGEPLSGAHAAENDVLATIRVLGYMRQDWGLRDLSWKELALVCEPEHANYIGATNHFVWDESGTAVFGFGKYKGQPLEAYPSYLRWMQGQSFSASVKETIKQALKGPLTRKNESK